MKTHAETCMGFHFLTLPSGNGLCSLVFYTKHIISIWAITTRMNMPRG